MKLILPVSFLFIILLSSQSDFFYTIDYSGIYQSSSNNPKVLLNQINFKKNMTFEYQCIVIDHTAIKHNIKGTYSLKGDKVELIPMSFQNEVIQQKKLPNNSPIKIRGLSGKVIDRNSDSQLFQQYVSAFEAGASKLLPEYHFKQLNNQLSLCSLQLRTGQYVPRFLKYEQ